MAMDRGRLKKKKYAPANNGRVLVLAALLLAGWGAASEASDKARCAPEFGRVVSVQGSVDVLPAKPTRESPEPKWDAATLNDALCAGDMVRVGQRSRAALRLSNETNLRLDQGTTLTLVAPNDKGSTLLDQISGGMHVITRTPKAFKVKTPFVNANVEGTEFAIRLTPNDASIAVYEGRIVAENDLGGIALANGEEAVATKIAGPKKELVVRPRDAVAWTLYFPTIFDYRLDAGVAEWPGESARQRSIDFYRSGKIVEALAALESVPEREAPPWFLTYRAGLLLLVGRLDEARPDIERALRIDASNGGAYSLLAVISLIEKDKVRALALAERAVDLDPKSAATWIARSYALQANFEIEQALANVQRAVDLDPQNALAWARLAELQMSTGNLNRGLAAAVKATELNPKLSKTQTVLGFASLVSMDTSAAKAAFEEAIYLDQSDPLPRLGLGLAKIRDGNLELGRVEIEIAAILDTQNSTIRSYLGKAYHEETRRNLAGKQFALAIERDPADPTPHLYDALKKQSEGRPVEAQSDLNKSIHLNDNRAVYRSRLLLDQDLAARSASLARIYDNLGFERLGLVEASKSLTLDPASFSAHHFLSDIYSALPRHEIARTSEILQAQLLAPLSLNPVKPNLLVPGNAFTNGYFKNASMNEYTTLFERNGNQFRASGILGNNRRRGEEAVLSAIKDRWSYSVGTLSLSSSGFRSNSDLNHRADDAFVQLAMTPTLAIQAELRSERLKHGDLTLNFDPDVFSSLDRRELRRQTKRIGLHVSPQPWSDIVVSLNRIDWHEVQHFFFDGGTADTDVSNRGNQLETQYIYRLNPLSAVLGLGLGRINNHEVARFDGVDDPPIDVSVRQNNVYLYVNIVTPGDLQWTVGLSHDSRRETASFTSSQFNPKFGLQWVVQEGLTIRMAAFSTINRTISGSQSIEPTQVAGFNQFFDDPNGTKTLRYGLGIDNKLFNNLAVGAEISRRNLKKPQLLPNDVVFEEQRERTINGYAYWTVDRRLVVSVSPEFDRFERVPNINTGPTPLLVRTAIMPVGARYFGGAGVILRAAINYVDQHVDRLTAFTSMSGRETFYTVNASVSYRLPSINGAISVEGRNLTGRRFRFQDESYRKIAPETPRFEPTRSIFANISLRF